MTRRTRDAKIVGEDFLLINPEDARSRGIQDGEKVRVLSPRGKASIRARVSEMVQPGILSSTFHFPEILINQVSSDVLDSEADCPEYKVVAVDVRKE